MCVFLRMCSSCFTPDSVGLNATNMLITSYVHLGWVEAS